MSLSNHDWETMAGILVGILTTKPLIFFYYINMKSPNFDLKQGISYLEREGERQRDRETERQRDRETERQRDRETERQRDREKDR